MDNIEKIINYLMLVSKQFNDASLCYGKTGMILALMMYAKAYESVSVKELVEECFNEIYYGFYDGMPVGREFGLAGALYSFGISHCFFDASFKTTIYAPI